MTSTKIIAKSSEYEFLKNWLNDGLLLSTGNWRQYIQQKLFFLTNLIIIIVVGILKIGKKWHDRRKIITQAFHFNILEKFTETFNRIGNVLIEKLNRYDADESIEFYPITALYALDVICGEFGIFIYKILNESHLSCHFNGLFPKNDGIIETAMGISVNALSKPNSEYVNAVKK